MFQMLPHRQRIVWSSHFLDQLDVHSQPCNKHKRSGGQCDTTSIEYGGPLWHDSVCLSCAGSGDEHSCDGNPHEISASSARDCHSHPGSRLTRSYHPADRSRHGDKERAICDTIHYGKENQWSYCV